MSKQPPPAPTASAAGPCPIVILCRTPQHWKSHHPTTPTNSIWEYKDKGLFCVVGSLPLFCIYNKFHETYKIKVVLVGDPLLIFIYFVKGEGVSVFI